ncbi:hypothetical protein [Synechococcus sp. MIT S9504]|uniref:hypothetical protein n=1 Tax=Synechococcus sp. MIT S9504 TaxID=1801628 RepID=UPI0012E8150A|nr:hypothetical protein [Synechococcus sp. MIT S9504]
MILDTPYTTAIQDRFTTTAKQGDQATLDHVWLSTKLEMTRSMYSDQINKDYNAISSSTNFF